MPLRLLLATLACLGFTLRGISAEAARAAGVTIVYVVKYDAAQQPRRVQVTLTVKGANVPRRLRLQMPVWSPGDYHIQDFAQNVRDVEARVAGGQGGEVRVAKLDANTWEVNLPPTGEPVVTYNLQETPPGFFSENVALRDRWAYFNGPAYLLYLVGGKDAPCELTAEPPQGWSALMPLPKVSGASSAFSFEAPDYDTLADSPLVMGAPDSLKTVRFAVDGIQHRAVFFNAVSRVRDTEAYAPVLKRIVIAGAKLMGGLPYPQYDFLFDVGGRGGGLEHLNACRIALPGSLAPERLANFYAHEFFHAWNVKRIRPRVLGPFDYVMPPKTRNLWFSEGVTDYYAAILTRRSGLHSDTQFFAHWRDSIAEYRRNPARRRVTADDSSLRVWEAGNSAGYGGLSYYDKGALVGLCLDLKIRQVSSGKRSLDDVMRALFDRTNFPSPGFGEDDIKRTVNDVAGSDLSAFYDLLVRSTEEMPFAEVLAYVGLDDSLNSLPDATPEQLALRKDWAKEF